MKLIKILSIFIFIFLFFFKANSEEKKNYDFVNIISKNIRCLVCQGQSIHDSQSDFALSMKLVIEDKVSIGLSEKEIYNYLKSQYGEWILYDPEFTKNTYSLWLLPILMFIFGGILILSTTVLMITRSE